ncbi:HAAS signaling domain-containing protein [Brevibacillus sp. NRS-1366]|uniref:HAAS signaling domain-containing protein n=1 Tax=Brevibacillus sp. NRS-1366 TaxID=3233899 RepID=UPI003D254407
MTRREFMDELGTLLGGLPDKERLDILADYTEHFLMGVKQGKSEHEIAEGLGSPKLLAKELLAGYRIDQAQSNASIGNMTRAIIATISLGFFNVVFVLGPFMGLIGVLIAFYAVSFSLLVAPIGIYLQYGVPVPSHERLFLLFGSMASLGLGGMLAVGLLRLTKWLYRLFLRYLQFNVQLIRGK